MAIGKLTLKQQKFADEYIICGNATEAAKLAGYAERSATVIGAENLIKPNIKSYIDSRMAELSDRKIMKAAEALEILSSIARGERDEEVLFMDPTTGEVKRFTKKADNATVIKAIVEILKRYPTVKQAEKLEAELALLKSKLPKEDDYDEAITIVDEWQTDNCDSEECQSEL